MDGLLQPPAPNAPPKAPSPLELAIYQFEQKCQEYHLGKAKAAPNDETPEQAKARNAAFHRDWEHLQSERTRIVALTQIQAELEQYRESNKSKSAREMSKEAHHPTDDLAKYLAAVAEPKPSPYHDAHHVIPGKGRWLQDRIANARLNMHLHGIGVSDPKNGAWLPRNIEHKGHWATPKAPAHKEIHRYNYETWISVKFERDGLPKIAFEAELRDIKMKLKYGGYPPEITMPKDSSWRGEEV
ncbi:AHH domain-containing protein [Microbulbifer litoralis]|uniref:AHH domain-containing protein n=1 Tax=Microbulbifer litoralis TaxID=2933965 RepID=UPI0020288058|nr:AHH domain-containing protein [Microbulbifer sp. GX H0434]